MKEVFFIYHNLFKVSYAVLKRPLWWYLANLADGSRREPKDVVMLSPCGAGDP